ncbi:hypothetical protein BRAO375_1030002 [Bradyrhizobium sp. ORS 375]|nr:hypothetical protein BRAO375_1030002 [Bradyrhizobium sp. ORS 375]
MPDLKLVSHPPLQLLADLSSLAILPWIESGAIAAGRAPDDALRAVDGVRWAIASPAAGFGLCGLATCFGVSTVTGGMTVTGPGVICETAGPDNKTVASTATAEGATTLGGNLRTQDNLVTKRNLMTISPRGRRCRPNEFPRDYTLIPTSKSGTWLLAVEKILRKRGPQRDRTSRRRILRLWWADVKLVRDRLWRASCVVAAASGDARSVGPHARCSIGPDRRWRQEPWFGRPPAGSYGVGPAKTVRSRVEPPIKDDRQQ